MADHKKIYMIGIGGTLMGGIAVLLKNMGYQVSGSDNKIYPPMSDHLKESNIEIFEGYRSENITSDIDLVLVGNVVSKGHPEMDEVIKRGIKYSSVPKFLEDNFLDKYTPVVIAGTHGKTTTTSLTTKIFDAVGLSPSFLLGGIDQNFKKSSHITQEGTPFIMEGDEYDTAYFDKVPKFSHYKPKVGVITSVEFDHADIYSDIYKLRAVFYRFASIIPKDGLLVYWDGIAGIPSLLRDLKAKKISYGFNPTSDIYCYSYRVERKKLVCSIKVGKKDYEFKLPFFGKHNVLNFLATLGTLLYFTEDLSFVQKGLNSFIPPKRRQEKIYDKNGVIVIDDFAHHPTAIRETIQAIKMQYPRKRIITLFEPRSNTSRQKIFQDIYPDSFRGSSWVLFTKPKKHRLIDDNNLLDGEKLKLDLKNIRIRADLCEDGRDILNKLSGKLRYGDLVLILSNGDFDGIYKDIDKIL